jgi:hypothetical protein
VRFFPHFSKSVYFRDVQVIGLHGFKKRTDGSSDCFRHAYRSHPLVPPSHSDNSHIHALDYPWKNPPAGSAQMLAEARGVLTDATKRQNFIRKVRDKEQEEEKDRIESEG